MEPRVNIISDRVLGEYSGPGEYPCVRRCRHRRLVTFLFLSGFRNTLTALIHETKAFFSVVHLCQFVNQGRWEDALSYLSRFLPPVSRPQSDEAQVLLHFLHMHRSFANIAARNKDAAVQYLTERYSHYANHDSTVYYGAIRIRSIILSILHSEQVRASLDWELVRRKAAAIVDNLVYKIPQLKDLVLMPGGPMMPQNVLPIGFGFRRRRHVKTQIRPPACALAKLYLEKKRRMPSSNYHQKLNRGLSTKARNWLADLLDESLKVGKRPELRQGYLLQSSKNEGAPVKAMFGTLPRTARNSEISPVINEGSVISQTMVGTLTNLAKNPDIISVTNAGTPVVPKTVFGNVTNPPKDSWISSVTNTSTPAAVCVTHPKDSLLPSVTGTGVPVAGNVIDPVNSLIQSVPNTDAPNAPVRHTMFGNAIDSTEKFGISSVAKTDEEDYYSESATRASIQKGIQEQLIITHGSLHTKKQRTAGAFGEASVSD